MAPPVRLRSLAAPDARDPAEGPPRRQGRGKSGRGRGGPTRRALDRDRRGQGPGGARTRAADRARPTRGADAPSRRGHRPGRPADHPSRPGQRPGQRATIPSKRSHRPGRRTGSPSKRSHRPGQRATIPSSVYLYPERGGFSGGRGSVRAGTRKRLGRSLALPRGSNSPGCVRRSSRRSHRPGGAPSRHHGPRTTDHGPNCPVGARAAGGRRRAARRAHLRRLHRGLRGPGAVS